MATVVKRRKPRSPFRLLATCMAWLLTLLVLAAAGLWQFGPALLAPREDFEQGPSGVVAYISLSNQLRTQMDAFWSGKDVQLTMNQEEFSGMVSSALLSGRGPDSPIRKVRAYLPEGEIQVDMVLELPYPQVPERYRNEPIGLTLDLQPAVDKGGQIEFRIAHAKVGRLPVPVRLIKWAGQRIPYSISGYDAAEAAIQLPISDLIANSFGRNIVIREFASTQGNLILEMAMPRK